MLRTSSSSNYIFWGPLFCSYFCSILWAFQPIFVSFFVLFYFCIFLILCPATCFLMFALLSVAGRHALHILAYIILSAASRYVPQLAFFVIVIRSCSFSNLRIYELWLCLLFREIVLWLCLLFREIVIRILNSLSLMPSRNVLFYVSSKN